jgi:hypothetical protein
MGRGAEWVKGVTALSGRYVVTRARVIFEQCAKTTS